MSQYLHVLRVEDHQGTDLTLVGGELVCLEKATACVGVKIIAWIYTLIQLTCNFLCSIVNNR